MENQYNGIIEDPRTDFEKSRDYKSEDLARGEVILNWREKREDEWKKYTIRNQDGSSACVAFATAKILGMHEVLEGKTFADLSPKAIYTKRQNYPDGGMWLPNALEIACKSGACLESFLPCDMQGEAYMNNKGQETAVTTSEALQYRAKYYFSVRINIDEIAKIIEQGYGVLLGFRFDYDEWTDVPFINPNSKLSCGHGVPAIDYLIHNGQKCLLIEDSWGPGYGKGGRRIITETFLMTRCFYAGYITSLPNYIFTKTLRIGSRGFDVKMLQEKLKSLGNNIVADGIFGHLTQLVVMNFQRTHQLVPDGIVGIRSCNVLNNI